MTVVLVLPTGAVVVDPEWHTVGDVMKSFHHFGVKRAFGQVVTEDGVPLTEMLPYPVDGSGG